MTAEEPTSAAGRQATTATALKAKIGMLQAEIAKLEAHVAGHQAEFRAALVEPDRAQQLMAELLRMTADLMAAREAESRLERELMALRSPGQTTLMPQIQAPFRTPSLGWVATLNAQLMRLQAI